MTPARAQLESLVAALRRKQLAAVAVTAMVELMLVAALMYALLRVGLPNIVLSPSRRMVLALGLLLVFVAAAFFEQARQARSVLYLAKQIDHANQLDDHLVSALSFADPPTSGFELACVNSLILRLQRQAPVIPEVRFERLWLLLPALLIAAGTGALDYRRRVRPTDDGSLKITLPAELRERAGLIEKTATETSKNIDPTLAQQAKDTKAMLDNLVDRSASKESAIQQLSAARDALDQYESKNPSLIAAALQLGDPSTQRASNLLNGLRSGAANEVNDALGVIAGSMEGTVPPPLSEEERAELGGILDRLAKATSGVQLKKKLEDGAQAIRDYKTGRGAGAPIEALKGPLAEQLTRDKATRELMRAMRNAQADAGRQVELLAKKMAQQKQLEASTNGGTADMDVRFQGGAGNGKANPDELDSDPPEQPGEGNTNVGGTGSGSAIDRNLGGGKPEEAKTEKDERITAPWVGAPVTQVVKAGSSNDPGAREAARVLLSQQQRQLEREVRREEIPAEYAQSIRRYFSNIQRSWEQQWKPSK